MKAVEIENEVNDRCAHLRENISVVRVMKASGADVSRVMRVICKDRVRLSKLRAVLRRMRRFASC